MAQGLDWLKVEVEFLLFSSEKSLRGKKKKKFPEVWASPQMPPKRAGLGN